jgi:hypothetical protein
MATKKISIDVDDSIIKSLGQRFPDLPDKEKLAASLAKLALYEWEQWFAARLRPKSISALNQERIQMVFGDQSLYSGRRVTRGLLFNQFNLPYGEASYLERVFAEKDIPDLSETALKSIHDDLDLQLKDWNKDKNKKEDQEFTIEVDKLGQRLLQSIMQKAKETGKQMAPSENVLKVHGYYNYTFSKEEAEVVLTIAKSFMEVYAK